MPLCRLYTGIHALKPKPRVKTGAICESTTALNVDHRSNESTDKEPQPPTPLGTSSKLLTQDQNANAISVTEPIIGPLAIPKKEGVRAAKAAQVDKKKIDARKKSLKRL